MEAYPLLGDVLRVSWARGTQLPPPRPSGTSQHAPIASASPLDHIQAIAQWYVDAKDTVIAFHTDAPILTSRLFEQTSRSRQHPPLPGHHVSTRDISGWGFADTMQRDVTPAQRSRVGPDAAPVDDDVSPSGVMYPPSEYDSEVQRSPVGHESFGEQADDNGSYPVEAEDEWDNQRRSVVLPPQR